MYLHSDYRYGFNGMEKDDEVKGKGNSYTTHFRQMDPRLGRWLTIDPVFQPEQSPYTSMDCNPIAYNDPNGDKVPFKLDRKTRKSLGLSRKEAKNTTPEKISSLFQEEYHIDVRVEDGYLIYNGEVSTKSDLKVSQTAKNMWINELREFDENGEPFIGQFPIHIHNESTDVDLGHFQPDGSGGGSIHIDIGDFNGIGGGFTTVGDKFLMMDKNASPSDIANLKRSFNMARVMEHEYFGHGIKGWDDN
ncbi:MAG: RHS repeat-associated protein, partial [Parvicella sp.]